MGTGSAYKGQGELENALEALEYYNKALEIKLQVHGDSHLAVASTLTDLGHVYSDKGDFKSSIDHFSKKLAFRL